MLMLMWPSPSPSPYSHDISVQVENSKGEAGIGQHELNVRYTNALDMSDRHVIYKQCLKEVADKV